MAGTTTTRVIVVGSTASRRHQAVQQLRERGLSVRLADSATVGLSLHRIVRSDVLLLEPSEPEDAVRWVRAFREIDADLPAIVLLDEEGIEDFGPRIGAIGRVSCLNLAFSDEGLFEAIDAALGNAAVEEAVDPDSDVTGEIVMLTERPPSTEMTLPPPSATPTLPPTASPPAKPRRRAKTLSQLAPRHTVWSKTEVEVPEAGGLSGHRLADVLHMLALDRRTGALTLDREGHRKTIFVENGRPVFVRSSLQHETLGAHLLRTKLIDEDQHRKAIEAMSSGGVRFGQALIDMGAIKPSEVLHYLSEHMHHKAISAFGWTDGIYAFTQMDELPGEITAVRMNPCTVILEGLRLHFDPSNLKEDFPAMDCTVGVQLDDPPYSPPQLALSETARRVLDQLIAGVAAPAITQAAGVALNEVMGIAYGLYVLQVVGFSDAPAEGNDVVELPPEDSSAHMVLGESGVVILSPECDAFLEDYLRMRPLDCFELLGLEDGADDESVAQAFAKLESRYHPSSFDPMGFESVREKIDELWARISDARQTLATEERRNAYRRSLDDRDSSESGTHATGRVETLTAEKHFRAGQAALARSLFDDAAEAFAAALALAPQEPAYVAHAAWTSYCRDPKTHRKPALTSLQQAMALDSSYLPARYFMGRICLQDGNNALALGYFQAVVRADPEDEDAARYLNVAAQRKREESEPEVPKPQGGLLRRLFRR